MMFLSRSPLALRVESRVRRGSMSIMLLNIL